MGLASASAHVKPENFREPTLRWPPNIVETRADGRPPEEAGSDEPGEQAEAAPKSEECLENDDESAMGPRAQRGRARLRSDVIDG
jgi:hypothetical protein